MEKATQFATSPLKLPSATDTVSTSENIRSADPSVLRAHVQQLNTLTARIEEFLSYQIHRLESMDGVAGSVTAASTPADLDRLIDLIRKFRGGVVDPAPEDFVNVRIKDLINIIPGGGVVDPAPEDLARLDKAQLETRLTEIDVARKRLDQLQGMIKDQLKRG